MAWSARDKKPVRRTFKTLTEAKRWRQAAQVDLRGNRLNAPSDHTLRDAARAWVELAHSGVVRTRSGEPYKPSAIRSYEAALARFVLPKLGSLRLSAVTKIAIQDLADQLVADGYAASTVANAVLPLRAIYRRAVEREEVSVNPTLGLRLPKDRMRKRPLPEPAGIPPLLEALRGFHRALWATAVYAGLRRGELQALGWESVDLDRRILRVERSWDRVAGLIAPKSRAGERAVPIPEILRAELIRHRLEQGVGGTGFVFSISGDRPFDPPNALRVARRAWDGAGVDPLGFHEARHTYASFMIAAGVNAKALSSYMGHSSITVTLDRYGHLMPGNEREAADRLDAYLAGAAQPRLVLSR